MERLVFASWVALALLHLPPALVLFFPDQILKLYGEMPSGPVGLMIRHRGALFVGLCVLGMASALQPDVRKVAVVVFAISMVSFIILYGLDGWQPGPLRTIAIADAIGLIPLCTVAIAAWRKA